MDDRPSLTVPVRARWVPSGLKASGPLSEPTLTVTGSPMSWWLWTRHSRSRPLWWIARSEPSGRKA